MHTASDILIMDRNNLALYLQTILVKGDNACQQHFVSKHPTEIDQFISYSVTAILLWKKYHSQMTTNKRNTWISSFCLLSINYLIAAFHLLISGYVIPSGNMNRHTIEAIAMAFLAAIPHLDVYKKFLNDEYRSMKAVYDLEKEIIKIKHIPLNQKAFSNMINFYKSYNLSSHLSLVEIGLLRNSPSSLTIGPHYNNDLEDYYKKELKRMLSLAKIYDNLFSTIILLTTKAG